MKKLSFLAIILISFLGNAQLTLVKTLSSSEIPTAEIVRENQIFKGRMYYFGEMATPQDCKLFVTDGTATGTVLLKDLGTIYTTGSGNYCSLGEFNQTDNLLYFTRSQLLNSSLGGMPTEITTELWVTDGTTAGTIKLLSKTKTDGYTVSPISLFSELSGTHPKNQNSVGNNLIFTAYDPASTTITWTNQITWVTDGTIAGTKPLLTNNGEKIYGGSLGGTKLNGEYFFGGRSQVAIDPGSFLYKTDGTSAGTQKVNPNEANFYIGSTFSKPLNGKFIFWATNNYGTFPQYNFEIWESDGTASGTKLFLETSPGMDSHKTYMMQSLDLANDGKQIYFTRQPDPNNNNMIELWATDITTANTRKIRANTNYLSQYIKIGNGFIYFDEASLPIGSATHRLCYTDGTMAGTKVLSNNNFNRQSMAIYNNSLFYKDYDQMKPYFGSTTVPDNLEVWRSDATTTNTKKILDVFPGTYNIGGSTFSNDSKPYNFFVLGDHLFFVATNPSNVYNLYKWKGDFTFTGSTNSNWNNASNWLASVTPGLQDLVNIPSGFNVSVDGNAYAKDFNLNSPLNLSSGNLNVSGTITLNSKINLNNNSLILKGNSSQIANGNSTNYIVTNGTGTVNIENLDNSRGIITLPIGTATNYNEIEISNSGTADTFSVKVSDGISNTTNGAVNATWDISEATSGGSNVYLSFIWNQSQENANFDRSTAKVGHYNGSVWNAENSGSVKGTDPYKISVSGITSFSPFAVMNFAPLGLNDISKSKVQVYPNPFNDNLNIQTQENGVVYFYDLSGKLVSTSIISKGNNSLNKSSLNKGVYLYQVKSKNGNIISSGKIIKK